MKSIKNRWWRITAVELIPDACAVKWRGFGGENNKFQSPAESRRGYVTGCKDRRRDVQSPDTCGPQPSSQPVRRHNCSSRVPRSWHYIDTVKNTHHTMLSGVYPPLLALTSCTCSYCFQTKKNGLHIDIRRLVGKPGLDSWFLSVRTFLRFCGDQCIYCCQN